MTPWETARKRLSNMVAANAEPELTNDDLDEILTLHRATDRNGNPPTSDEWTATFRMNKAAAEGWQWKAARASELISVDLDGERMSSNQIFHHCMEMVKTYSRKGAGTVTLTTQ